MSDQPSSPDELEQLRAVLHQWQLATFPNQSAPAKAKHLEKEARELFFSLDGWLSGSWRSAKAGVEAREELADCLLLLLGIASLLGMTGETILAEAWAKLEINTHRKWGPPDADGVTQHIE